MNEKTTEEQTKDKLRTLNPFNISDEDFEFASKMVDRLYCEDKILYYKANEVVQRLHLGGFWRGVNASVLIVAQAIKEGE